MPFEFLENDINVKKVNGYPTCMNPTANSIPLAGFNAPGTPTSEQLQLPGEFLSLAFSDLIKCPGALTGNENKFIKYKYSTDEFIFVLPEFKSTGYATICHMESTRLLMQWGSSIAPLFNFLEGTVSVTFPTAFSAAPYVVSLVGRVSSWSTSEYNVRQLIDGATSTGFSWYNQLMAGLAFLNGIYWIAIGPV